MRSFTVLFFLLINYQTYSQCTVNASNGNYTVTAEVYPLEVNAPATCDFGYNFTVNVGYRVIINGSNVPPNLYTSQGNLNCTSLNTNGSGTANLFVNLSATDGIGTGTTTGSYSNRTNCTTSSPASLGCNSFTYQVSGPNLSYTTVTCPILDAALPVTLQYFTREQQDELNLLSWKIANETGFDYFVVERSFDAKSFEAVSPKITYDQEKSFSFADSYRIERVAYYRLKMVDKDLSVEYSNLIAINRDNSLIDFTISPNPSADEIYLSWNKNNFKPVRIVLTSMDGRVLLKTVIADSNPNAIIDVAKLAQQQYIVTLFDINNNKLSKKIAVQ